MHIGSYIRVFSIGLFLTIAIWPPVAAQDDVEDATLRAEVFERLVIKLETLPKRWGQLPAPVIAASGRQAKDVLGTASKGEVNAAQTLIMRLAHTPPKMRPNVLEEARESRKLSEIDLWVPKTRALDLLKRDVLEAALTVDAWLDLSEQLGRRDTLLEAAAMAIQISNGRMPPRRVLRVAEKLVSLSPDMHGQRGAAKLANQYAYLLLQAGDSRRAVEAYRQARKHYLSVGSQQGQGDTWFGEGRALFRLGDNVGTLKAYRQARRHYVSVGSQQGQGDTWFGEGRVLFFLGDNESALKAYRQARKHLVRIHDQWGQGNTFIGEGRVLFRQGENAGALKAYRRARKYYVASGALQGRGISWHAEASVLLVMGDKKRALKAYRQARKLFVAAGERQGAASLQGLGNSWVGEGKVLFGMGDNEGALQAYQQARQYFVLVGSQQGQGNSWYGEGRVLFLLGNTEGALKAYRQARKLFMAVGDPAGQGDTWFGEGKVLFLLGHHEGALGAYQQAHRYYMAIGSRLAQGNTFIGEGRVLFLLEDNEGALKAYRQARKHFVADGDRLGQGNARLGEAAILFRLGDNEGALRTYRQARKHFVAVADPLGRGHAWEGEAHVLLRLGKAREAERAGQRAAAFAARGGPLIDNISARMAMAQSLADQGRHTKANQQAFRALALVKRWRAKGLGDLSRTALANLSSAPFDFLIPRLARKSAKALALAEDAHAPVLLDLLVASTNQILASNQRNQQRERVRIHKELAKLQATLTRTLDRSARSRFETQRDALDRELGLIELATLGALQNRTGQRISARERRMLTRHVGPIVLYYVAPEETLAFVLRPGRQPLRVVRIAASRNDFGREVQALRHDLGNPLWQKRADQRARTLFNQLVGPIADQLAGSSRLTIIPHGPLHQLPFEALIVPDGDEHNGKRVFERWDITVAPSLSVLHRIRKQETARRRKSKAAPFIALAAGQGLHFPDREVQDIAAIFGRDQATFRQGNATFATYQKQAARARHLLISTHGVHIPNSRTGTYLELTPTTEHDHRLTAGEIAQIPLRAELVTLAACSTAQGEAMFSDERLDLTRAFLIAGASAVLATRWKVPESNATRQFLIDFYRALRTGGPKGQGMRKDAALSHARRLSMKRGDDAQLWAAWVLIGDGR